MSLLRFGFHAPASPLDEIRNRANDVNTHALMHWKSLRMEVVVERLSFVTTSSALSLPLLCAFLSTMTCFTPIPEPRFAFSFRAPSPDLVL